MKEYGEAADAMRHAVASHKGTEDNVALGLRYDLMMTLADCAQREENSDLAEEAAGIAADLVQNHGGFRDVTEQLERINQLVRTLGGAVA